MVHAHQLVLSRLARHREHRRTRVARRQQRVDDEIDMIPVAIEVVIVRVDHLARVGCGERAERKTMNRDGISDVERGAASNAIRHHVQRRVRLEHGDIERWIADDSRELPIVEVEKQSHRFLLLQGSALGLAGGLLIVMYPVAIRFIGGNLISYQGLSPELLLLVLYYVISIPWWHCQNYFLAFDKGQQMMKMNLVVSSIGFIVLVLSMWLWGPFGFYIGFLAQMVLRSAGIVIVARLSWPLSFGLGGMAAGAAITLIGFAASQSEFGHYLRH